MQKQQVVKRLLAVSAVAAMFSAFGVHAQTGAQNVPSALQPGAQGSSNLTGKTAHDGTIGNTNSQGVEDRSAMVEDAAILAQASGSSSGSVRDQTTGSSSGSAGMSGSTGTAGTGASGTAGAGTSSSADQSGAAGQAGATSGTSGSSGASGQSGTAGMQSGTSGTGAAATGGATTTQATAGAGATKLSKADSKAMMDLAEANMAEIEAAKLALSKSQNSDVKTFAQQMIDDHGKALSEAQTLAQSKGVTLPTGLNAKHKEMSAKLEKLSGDEFDRAYMKQAGVAEHKQMLARLQKNAKNVKDPELKALATKMEPTVEQHLKAAQQMAATKGGTTSGK